MAAPGTMPGKDATVSIGGTAYEGQLTTFSLSINGDIVDVTTMGNDWKYQEQTLLGYSGSFTAKFDNSNAQQEAIEAALLAGTDVAVIFGMGSTAGDKTYTGNIKINTMDTSPAVESIIEVSISFTGNGDITAGTVSA